MKTDLGIPTPPRPISAALAIALIVLLGTTVALPHVQAATLTVTTTADTGPDAPAPGSLRAALASAADGDTVDATGIAGTITLVAGAVLPAELVVNKSVTILGPGAANLAVDANQLSRVFRITAGHTVVFEGFKITNGKDRC